MIYNITKDDVDYYMIDGDLDIEIRKVNEAISSIEDNILSRIMLNKECIEEDLNCSSDTAVEIATKVVIEARREVLQDRLNKKLNKIINFKTV